MPNAKTNPRRGSLPRRTAGRPTGDLKMRERILSAAVQELLDDPGMQSTTIATLCLAADCTPPTLYHYWPDKGALLTDAAGVVWEQFRAAVAPKEDDPSTRLLSRGHAYLDFALERGNAFRLLFLPPAGSPIRLAPQATTPGAGLQDLIDDVASMTAGEPEAADTRTRALTLWAFVHGVACLWLGRDGLDPRDAHDLLDAGIGPLLAGGRGGRHP